ncbi:D-arabinono-1,4-lactone oxidase [Micromonospora sp. NPDC049891]|uniref:D-arabinono-1,4-lactone oxidase n=1 Tax=Micromonospora sp. NPDC049891 TaxID=3155655 RepID=UPI0033EC6CF7
MTREWRNWSGSIRFTPRGILEPADESEVVQLVRRARDAGGTLRPVGSGHSSSPLVRTDGFLVSVDRLAGVLSHDAERGRATVGAGTRLEDLGEGLFDAGLAMENLGDVDYQTIAGATATGTHGTGPRFGNLSTQIAEVRLVTGTGEVLDISADRNAELLPAARLSLGALGVVTRLTLDVQKHFEVVRRTWCAPLDWTLEHREELQQRHRNLDFYWYPRSDLTQVRALDERDDPPAPSWTGPIRELETGPLHHKLPQDRDLRFEEIEYMLPSEAFDECFAAVRRRILDRHRVAVAWRLLVRTIAADDIHLSNANGRATTTIACLHNVGLPHEEYFADLEAIFRDFGGRPHWGKKHSLTAKELRELYPDWDTFAAIRRRLDPDGVLLTPDLARLLKEA